ncbi:hypothetical protein [Caminicella sporogenes]|uniref:DUF7793 family protein n=1 Tax=Caminicella sporogenes TaxID=166485 RepID=UPI00254053F9|nr:hypothetical protein [Caminicella sporogenes]WIF95193.1 hypothetical protein QNI18_00705 [Caminicella sporogenes]
MEIKDIKGKYIIRLNPKRNLVYETCIGYWKPEDVERLHREYIKKIIPIFKGKQWAKCCDLKAYKTSMITQDIKKYANLWTKNGYVACAVIIDDSDIYKSVIKLQMKLSVKNMLFKLKFFTNIKEADKWLKSEGF